MKRDDLLALAQRHNYTKRSQERFSRALTFIKQLLSSKPRLSGDSYFDHNHRVGLILVENTVAPEIVLAGLLHGTLKYTSLDEISKLFGKDVAALVEGVSRLEALKLRNPTMDSESLRRVLLSTLEDFRVILIKLANKLDNLHTIDVFSAAEKRRIAQEVLDFYAPLAYRLGMEKLRVALEDEAFRIINPRKYAEIMGYLEQGRAEREEGVKQAIRLVHSLCKSRVGLVRIKGRPKHVYSIYRKFKNRGVPLDKQYDLLGIRVIVKSTKDCYILLGLLHEHFTPIDGRLKDYIANPKSNYYRSLHTGVLLSNGKRLEVQIRTPQMDEFAEEGLAAHWRYKRIKSDALFEKRLSWLRALLSMQKDGGDFLETARVDVFGDKIYCYTPKGDVKELPKGASLLDFAFGVHEQVGSQAIGGRVNGKFVPLRHKLEIGDVVEVLTSKNQRPRRTWLKIVASARSRQKIRKALRVYEKIAPSHYRVVAPKQQDDVSSLAETEAFENAICTLAKCCHPLPGEPIVGILNKRRMVSVHKPDCKQAVKLQERWIPANWKQGFTKKIRFYVVAQERSGLLADLLHTIARAGFEVKDAKAKLIGGGREECTFLVAPRDLSALVDLIKRLRKVKGVAKIMFE